MIENQLHPSIPIFEVSPERRVLSEEQDDIRQCTFKIGATVALFQTSAKVSVFRWHLNDYRANRPGALGFSDKAFDMLSGLYEGCRSTISMLKGSLVVVIEFPKCVRQAQSFADTLKADS
jgi:hypothetical protein